MVTNSNVHVVGGVANVYRVKTFPLKDGYKFMGPNLNDGQMSQLNQQNISCVN